MGKLFGWIASFVILGAIGYGIFTAYRDSHPSPLSPAEVAKDNAFELSLTRSVETIPLHDVRSVGTDGYVAHDSDGSEYLISVMHDGDGHECYVVGDVDSSDSDDIRKEATKPIFLRRYKPTEGGAFWSLEQGDESCEVAVKH